MLKEIEETIPAFMELTGKGLEDTTRLSGKLSNILQLAMIDGRREAKEHKEIPGDGYFLEISRRVFGKPDPDAALLIKDYFVEGYNSARKEAAP